MKKTIAVIFGGQSSEHEVSCLSCVNIVDNINKDRYHILLVGITKEGHWLKVDTIDEVKNDTWRNSVTTLVFSPDATEKNVLCIKDDKVNRLKIDIAFPVLHGLFGEDGTIQGLLELAQIPYVGCGVLASSVAMDKTYTKIIVNNIGVHQADYLSFDSHNGEKIDNLVEQINQKFTYPVFIKPSNSGSSQGITKAHSAVEARQGLLKAFQYDSKLLVEETIIGRELECGVLQSGGKYMTSGVGEILPAADFYDYDAKYNDVDSKTLTNPELPDSVRTQIRQAAIDIFKAISGNGLARVDFFLTKSNQVVFNEINTMPGFTNISMYPLLWNDKGIDNPALIEALIESATFHQSLATSQVVSNK